MAIQLIPDQRQIHTSLLISRPDGVTWVDVSPYLSRVSAERGDVTNIGVGGNDGVLQLLKFDLYNDGSMMPTWRSDIARDEADIVGDESLIVGKSTDSAANIIDLLFGVKHRYERDSFSPHDKKSAWNRNDNDEYEPLLWDYREVVLAIAITGVGEEPTENDWIFPFHGYLGEKVGLRANGGIVSVDAKSLSKLLQDTLIEVERTYGSEEGILLEAVMQQIIDDNLGAGVVELFCPFPTNVMEKPYTLKDKSVWDALQELAGKVGWFIGDRWDETTKAFRLTFMEPPVDKDASAADYRFTWTDDIYVQELDSTDRHYRNAVIVEYWDEELGGPQTVPAEKPGSPRRAMKIGLGNTELIRTRVEALRLANAALHDLGDDTTLCRVTMPLFPRLDTFDGVVIDNPRVASEDMFFGVDTVRHDIDFDSKTFVTEFVGSGRVVGGRYKWRKMQTRPGAYLPTAPEEIGGGGILMPAPLSVLLSPIDEGLSVYVPAPPVHLARWGATEIHVSTVQGFSPDASTLAAEGQATRFTVSPLSLAPHYVRARYVDVDGKPGAWSDEYGDTPKPPYEPDMTPPDAPVLGVLVPQAIDLGNSRYDISVTVPFEIDERTIRVIFERRERTSTNPDVWGAWREVGQAKGDPWVDRGGLKAPGTYQYRSRAESAVGVSSALSNVRQVTIPIPTVLPATVTGLSANFDTPDLVVSWVPVPSATEYRVQIRDSNGMRREQKVTASSYRYTYADNVADGAPPAPNLTVRVWAINGFGNESVQHAEIPAEQPSPGTPVGLIALPTYRKHVLTWDRAAPPPDIARYELQASTRPDGGSWSAWTTVDNSVQGIIYAHDDLNLALEYRYQLRSVSAFGLMSGWTNHYEAGKPGKISLSEDVIGRLARGDLAEDIIDELDGIVTIEQDLRDAEEDISTVAQTAAEISKTVAKNEWTGVYSGTVTSYSQSNARITDSNADYSAINDGNNAPLKDLQGYVVQLLDGGGTPTETRVIVANTKTTLTLDSAFAKNPTAGTPYRLAHVSRIASSTFQQHANQIALRLMTVDENGNPVPSAQLVIANVDGQGRIYLGADTIVDGKLTLTGDMEVVGGNNAVRMSREGVWGYTGNTKRAGFGTDGRWVAGGGAIEADEQGLRAKKGNVTTFEIDTEGNAFFRGQLGAGSVTSESILLRSITDFISTPSATNRVERLSTTWATMPNMTLNFTLDEQTLLFVVASSGAVGGVSASSDPDFRWRTNVQIRYRVNGAVRQTSSLIPYPPSTFFDTIVLPSGNHAIDIQWRTTLEGLLGNNAYSENRGIHVLKLKR